MYNNANVVPNRKAQSFQRENQIFHFKTKQNKTKQKELTDVGCNSPLKMKATFIFYISYYYAWLSVAQDANNER